MKKNILTAASFTILAVLMTGCKKDATLSPSPALSATKKLVRIDYDFQPGNPQTLTYDTQGRLINTEDSSYKTTLTYNGNTVDFVNFYKTENRNYVTGTFTLNARGLATEYDLVQYPTALTSDWRKNTLSYDADGHLIKTSSLFSGGANSEVDLDYTNGNFTTETFKTNGNLNGVWKYSYTGLEDKAGIFNDFPIVDNTMGGTHNKNLPAKAEQYDANNVKVFEAQYEYTLDADGYMTKMICHYITTNKNYTYSYTYK